MKCRYYINIAVTPETYEIKCPYCINNDFISKILDVKGQKIILYAGAVFSKYYSFNTGTLLNSNIENIEHYIVNTILYILSQNYLNIVLLPRFIHYFLFIILKYIHCRKTNG